MKLVVLCIVLLAPLFVTFQIVTTQLDSMRDFYGNIETIALENTE